ncbi:MAG: TlpA family protein disulfide reductase [Desulfobulbaceae bacterium]
MAGSKISSSDQARWLHAFSPWVLLLVLVLLAGCGGDSPANLKIGDPAPPFTVQGLDGKTISLADYQGSPVVVRFFLTDCKYCRADTPILNEYYTRYAAKGLRVLYVDTLGIDQGALAAFASELAIKFPVARDVGGKITASYRVKALPQTIVLSPDHKIIGAILGGVSEPELNRLLSPYLQ